MGMSYHQQDMYEPAIKAYEEAISLGRLIGQSVRLGSICNNLASAYSNLGRDEEALATFQMALNIYNQRGNKISAALTLSNMGDSHQRLRQNNEAEHAYRQAWQIASEVGDESRKLLTIGKLARFVAKYGKLNEALIHIETARTLLENPEITSKVRMEYLRDTYANFAEALLTVATTEAEIWEVLRYQKEHKTICRKSGQLETITILSNKLSGIVRNGHKLASSPPALIILHNNQ
jgi:tetratricopeptide (TPR) repeat protein